MRILHVIKSLDLRYGGPPRSTVGLCRALATAGHDVTILTTGTDGWDQATLHTRHAHGGALNAVVTDNLVGMGKVLSADTHIVHMQSVWSLANARLASFLTTRGVPYVLSPRGELDEWSMRQKIIKKRLYLGLLGRRLVRRAAALHLLNDDERDGLRRLNLEGRCFVVPNGIEPGEWPDDPFVRAGSSDSATPSDIMLILFFARLHHKKGPVILAEAFAKIADEFPGAKLIVCGPDYGELTKIDAVISEAGLSGRVECPGMIDGNDRVDMLRNADIFVLPSLQEGHPRNVLEAAIMGKAMIITPECHCPEFVDGESAIIVRPGVDAVAAGLRQLLEDHTLRNRIGKAARSTVLANYSWEQIADRVLGYYDSCLSSPDALTSLQ